MFARIRPHALSLFFGVIFVLALVGQSIAGFYAFNAEQSAHGQAAVTFGEFVTSSDFVVDAPVEDERTWDDPDTDWETDRFVPPPPPPVPTTTFDRQAAWAGVFGSPVVLLACLLLRIDVPELLAYALVGSFVGGFVYLVVKMTREPRDPDDDGAVL